eukprot:209299-Chlamydomonas_euryale.AAC.1
MGSPPSRPSRICRRALSMHAGIASLFYVYGALGFVWLAVWDPSVSHVSPREAAAGRAAAEDARA